MKLSFSCFALCIFSDKLCSFGNKIAQANPSIQIEEFMPELRNCSSQMQTWLEQLYVASEEIEPESCYEKLNLLLSILKDPDNPLHNLNTHDKTVAQLIFEGNTIFPIINILKDKTWGYRTPLDVICSQCDILCSENEQARTKYQQTLQEYDKANNLLELIQIEANRSNHVISEMIDRRNFCRARFQQAENTLGELTSSNCVKAKSKSLQSTAAAPQRSQANISLTLKYAQLQEANRKNQITTAKQALTEAKQALEMAEEELKRLLEKDSEIECKLSNAKHKLSEKKKERDSLDAIWSAKLRRYLAESKRALSHHVITLLYQTLKNLP